MQTGWPSPGFKKGSVMYIEKKWKTNLEKVSFAKAFPGLIRHWDEVVGQAVQAIVPVEGKSVFVLIFEGGKFAFISPMEPQPSELLAALSAARLYLERYHPEAYGTLDRFSRDDREMQRMARLENIVGAIRNNLPQIPELKETLRNLLEEIDAAGGTQ